MKYKNIGIIGAGIAGLTCARRLHRDGFTVTILEKSRGVGGRSATRHLDESSCDHGAQYFTVNDPLFAAQTAAWRDAGVVDIWRGEIVSIDDGIVRDLNQPRERWVGTPGMNSLGKSLAADLDLRNNIEVKRIERSQDKWVVWDQVGHTYGPFDVLLSTAPPTQTSNLFSKWSLQLAAQLERVTMRPCWAVILQFPARLMIEYDAAFVNGSSLSWIARNNSKPGRGTSECWVLHASAEWSIAHIEDEAESVGTSMIDEFWKLCGGQRSQTSLVAVHRWRYAIPGNVLPARCVFDDQAGLGIAGDWCGGPRVEGAFLSGDALARQLSEAQSLR